MRTWRTSWIEVVRTTKLLVGSRILIPHTCKKLNYVLRGRPPFQIANTTGLVTSSECITFNKSNIRNIS